MRWMWRGFAVLGVAAAIGLLVFAVVAEVRVHQRVGRMDAEIRHICSQFTAVDCERYPNAKPNGRAVWNPDTESWEFTGD